MENIIQCLSQYLRRMPEPRDYMLRALSLARLGEGFVAPNPLVGAVLVAEDRIIGEGFHQAFGKAHAEVEAIRNATERGHGDLLSLATLYVNLEPCSHHGKTPPCTELILKHRIPRVVIANQDPFEQVNGAGILRLKEAGTEVLTGIEEQAGRNVNRRFFCFHEKKRPYITLKWAQTADGFLGPLQPEAGRRWISGPMARKLVHRWRSEEAAILVGSRTALTDDPRLDVRDWPGPSPLRLVIDRRRTLPSSLHLFDGTHPTWIITREEKPLPENTGQVLVPEGGDFLKETMNILHSRNIQSVFVEGGAALLQSLIDAGLWDEARYSPHPRGPAPGVGLYASWAGPCLNNLWEKTS